MVWLKRQKYDSEKYMQIDQNLQFIIRFDINLPYFYVVKHGNQKFIWRNFSTNCEPFF